MKLVVQVKLRSPNEDGNGFSERTCFVDDTDIRRGQRIKLKNSEDPDRWWKVMRVSNPVDASVIHTDWEAGGHQGVARLGALIPGEPGLMIQAEPSPGAPLPLLGMLVVVGMHPALAVLVRDGRLRRGLPGLLRWHK